MQTTLLGIAIALILALLAALVGPLCIDWGNYRGELEAQARALTGLEFRVTGPIDARLLPTPSLTLQDIELGHTNGAGTLSARAVRVEFALGPFLRGEWRITEAELEAPEVAVEIEDSGRLAWPIPNLEMRPEGVAIERLRVTDGRAVLADAASGSRLVLDRVSFKGELRSLAGPLKGEGSVVAGGQQYSYRIGTGRLADDSSMRVRLSVEPLDHPLIAEADVSLVVDGGRPRFEGNVQFARLVGRAPAGTQALIIQPWRLSGRVRGNGGGALLDQVEYQYGPDERATKLRGSGSVTFGRDPQLIGTLTSPQIDVDRLLALPEGARRSPAAVMKALSSDVTSAVRLPIPMTLTIGVDALTLGGATLQRVASEVKGQDGYLDGWLEFRAPGVTQVRLEGRLSQGPEGINFNGLTQVGSSDPRAALAWLFDRTDMPALAGPMHLGAHVTFTHKGVALDTLDIELDRMKASGTFQYTWARAQRPARVDASMRSPGIDLDRVRALAKAVLGDVSLDWPGEGALSLAVDQVSGAGMEAKQANVDMRFDPQGIEIARLAIAELGGATITATGRIGTKADAPHGTLTVDVDARVLDGALAMLAKIAPDTAESLEKVAGRLIPLRMRASLAVAPRAKAGAETNAKFEVLGDAGLLRVAVKGDASTGEAFKMNNLAGLAAAKVHVSGHVDAQDGAALAGLTGLDRLIALDDRPGRLSFAAIGPLNGQLALEARFAAGMLDLAASGTGRMLAASDATAVTKFAPSVGVALKVANANILFPRPSPAGQRPEQLPGSLETRLAWSDGLLRLTSLKGTIAGTSIGGWISLDFRQAPATIDGEVDLGAVDLATGLATLIGIPASATADGTATGNPSERATDNTVRSSLLHWPAEPFEQSPLRRLAGQIEIRSARVALTPKLAAAQVRAVLGFGPPGFGLQGIGGNLAGGQLNGDLIFFPRADGLEARGRIMLKNASAADLLPGEAAVAGRLSFDATVEGAGRSVVALIGSLEGSGTFYIENGRLARLNPAAFDAIIRAVERGLPIDVGRVKERMEVALAAGGLAVPLAHGAVTVRSGQARLSPAVIQAQGADLSVSGSIDMAHGAIDARLVLSGAAATQGSTTRPEVIVALKGPLEAPRRTTDVAALASWLALFSVEQQSKKLDVLEGRASPPAPAVAPATSEPVMPVEPAPRRPIPRSAPKPKAPIAEQAPALPPPVDIRPAPLPLPPRAAGPQPAPSQVGQPQQPKSSPMGPQPTPSQVGQPQQPKSSPTGPQPAPLQAGQPQQPKPAPTRPRSLSEILFGN